MFCSKKAVPVKSENLRGEKVSSPTPLKPHGKLKTLLLTADGYTWKSVRQDTFRGFLGLERWQLSSRRLDQRLLYRLLGDRDRYASLGYIDDWAQAFRSHPALTTSTCNINNLVALGRAMLVLERYDLIVVLHSALGDFLGISGRLAGALRRRRGKLLVLIGNEYDLMSEKIRFVRRSRADYLGTQLPLEPARWIYRRTGSTLVAMPHGLNPGRFYPRPEVERTRLIGFRGNFYPLFVGDEERTEMIRRVADQARTRGENVDISTRRVTSQEWSLFLSSCAAIPGAEAGTYYADEEFGALQKAKSFLAQRPDATLPEVFEHAFAGLTQFVSGKAISSRHFEPIGTKTCQILLEGHYNGILKPDEHYIEVKRDFSNLEQAMEKLRDVSFRERLAEQAYAEVMEGHTYRHRVDQFLKTLGY